MVAMIAVVCGLRKAQYKISFASEGLCDRLIGIEREEIDSTRARRVLKEMIDRVFAKVTFV